MSIIKEFREFFLRSNKVTSGNKADQEVNYPTTTKINGVDRGNRFLEDHFPTENVFKKFFESITFKLNPEDSATSSTQGLVKKASDADAIALLANPSSNMPMAVVTHQLPEVITTTAGGDVINSTIIDNGISISKITRTITGALTRRIYKVALAVDKSITIDGSTKKVQLLGDNAAPGSSKYYGTDGTSNKGWYDIPKGILGQYLVGDFNISGSATPVQITSGSSALRIALSAGKYYKFRVQLLIDPANTEGYRVTLDGLTGLTATSIIYDVTYKDQIASIFANSGRGTALTTAFVGDTLGNGVLEIEGTILVGVAGSLIVKFAQRFAGAGTSTVKAGSSITVTEILAVA